MVTDVGSRLYSLITILMKSVHHHMLHFYTPFYLLRYVSSLSGLYVSSQEALKEPQVDLIFFKYVQIFSLVIKRLR